MRSNEEAGKLMETAGYSFESKLSCKIFSCPTFLCLAVYTPELKTRTSKVPGLLLESASSHK